MIIDDNSNHTSSPPSDQIPTPSDVNIRNPKRKRRPAGTPDPDAEVVSLSPRTLLESDRYLCEICGQGFQREQNLQMHRRRHKVPWKLLKRPDNGGGPNGGAARKRVYVCPEETCLHHQAAHALGDLVGIKKHFKRKHSGLRQWMCAKCSKAYAVHSDFKAHLKTCGTRGHSCDCGRVFSRVESFIEHQDACNMGRTPAAVCLSPSDHSIRTTNENNNSSSNNSGIILKERHSHNLELQLLTATPNLHDPTILDGQYHSSSRLHLSIGSSSDFNTHNNKDRSIAAIDDPVTPSQVAESEGEGIEQARLEKAYADEARREAKLDMEKAEREFANARRIRQHARAELNKAHALKDHAANRIRATLLEITCHACKQHVEAREREARQGTSSYSSPNAILGCQGDNRINQTQHVA